MSNSGIVLVSVTVIKTVIKSSLGGKELFGLQFPITVRNWGKPQQEPETGTETEAMEEHYLFACPPGLAQFAFLYNTGPLAHK